MLFSTLVALGCLQGANGAAYDKNAEVLHCSSFDGGMPDWIKDGGWIILFIALMVSFWGLAVVCEDYFVPAITILCEYNKIPDDVAGATFMAAGASSPEMFACFISLFVTHTALGAGTIIGSEIFNHLCITAAAVLYAVGGELQLDWRMVLREALFYLFALLLLIASLCYNSTVPGYCRDDVYSYYRKANNECNHTGGMYLRDSNDPKDWVDPPFVDAYCVYWWQGLFLVGAYTIYALVCAYFEQIKARFCPDKEEPRISENGVSETRSSGYENEPSANFGADRQSQKEPTAGDLQMAAFAPAHIQGNFLYNIHLCEEVIPTKFSCYMWKRSRFYHVRSISQNAWKLRWFEMDNGTGLQSFTSNNRKTKNRKFPINGGANLERLDEARLLFALTTKKHGKMVFHAPNQESYDKMYNQIEAYIQSISVESGASNPLHASKGEGIVEAAHNDDDGGGDDEHEDHHILIEWPHDAGPLTVFVHCVLIVPKYLVYYSIPDVRIGGVAGEKKYPQSIAMCFVWLISWSIVMAECLGYLGDLCQISELTMGMTVAAVGTSFPNVFASIIVAKQGLGNMACSNALGGNVFNVFMGLGLPWLCYSLFGLGFTVDSNAHMYYGMDYGGKGNAVLFPIIVLIALICGHMLLLISTGFKLYKFHAYIFIAIYVAFLIWVLFYHTKSPLDG
jgi:Ca2+/Na+ antiporter